MGASRIASQRNKEDRVPEMMTNNDEVLVPAYSEAD